MIHYGYVHLLGQAFSAEGPSLRSLSRQSIRVASRRVSDIVIDKDPKASFLTLGYLVLASYDCDTALASVIMYSRGHDMCVYTIVASSVNHL